MTFLRMYRFFRWHMGPAAAAREAWRHVRRSARMERETSRLRRSVPSPSTFNNLEKTR